MNLEIKVESPSFAQIHRVDGKAIVIPAEGMVKGVFFIKIPEENVLKARTVVTLGIYQNGERIETVKAKFIGPVKKASDAKRD